MTIVDRIRKLEGRGTAAGDDPIATMTSDEQRRELVRLVAIARTRIAARDAAGLSDRPITADVAVQIEELRALRHRIFDICALPAQPPTVGTAE